jgi:hypothetical protein
MTLASKQPYLPSPSLVQVQKSESFPRPPHVVRNLLSQLPMHTRDQDVVDYSNSIIPTTLEIPKSRGSTYSSSDTPFPGGLGDENLYLHMS